MNATQVKVKFSVVESHGEDLVRVAALHRALTSTSKTDWLILALSIVFFFCVAAFGYFKFCYSRPPSRITTKPAKREQELPAVSTGSASDDDCPSEITGDGTAPVRVLGSVMDCVPPGLVGMGSEDELDQYNDEKTKSNNMKNNTNKTRRKNKNKAPKNEKRNKKNRAELKPRRPPTVKMQDADSSFSGSSFQFSPGWESRLNESNSASHPDDEIWSYSVRSFGDADAAGDDDDDDDDDAAVNTSRLSLVSLDEETADGDRIPTTPLPYLKSSVLDTGASSDLHCISPLTTYSRRDNGGSSMKPYQDGGGRVLFDM